VQISTLPITWVGNFLYFFIILLFFLESVFLDHHPLSHILPMVPGSLRRSTLFQPLLRYLNVFLARKTAPFLGKGVFPSERRKSLRTSPKRNLFCFQVPLKEAFISNATIANKRNPGFDPLFLTSKVRIDDPSFFRTPPPQAFRFLLSFS